MNCAVCGEPGRSRCSVCREARYCSKKHQVKHWKTHKQQCIPLLKGPYFISWYHFGHKARTRGLFASRDITKDEEVIKEIALLSNTGPNRFQKDCYSCANEQTKDRKRFRTCNTCGFKVCNKKGCHRLHSKECRALLGLNLCQQRAAHLNDERITVLITRLLRVVFLHKSNGATGEEWKKLNHLNPGPARDRPYQGESGEPLDFVYDMLIATLKAISYFADIDLGGISDEELQRVHSICEVNMFGHESSQLFHDISLMNHSCAPNCLVEFHEVDDPQGGNLYATVTATSDIRKGEQLTIDYLLQTGGKHEDINSEVSKIESKNNAERTLRIQKRKRLEECFFFYCECPSCMTMGFNSRCLENVE